MIDMRCRAPRCPRDRPEDGLFCGPHWAKLPHYLRAAIARHYRPGDLARASPSPELMLAVLRASNHLGVLEGTLSREAADLHESRVREVIEHMRNRARPG